MNWDALWLSVRVSLIATAIVTVVGVAGADTLAKAQFRGRALIEAIASLPIVLPPTVLGYYLLTALGRSSAIGRAYERLTGSTLTFSVTGAIVAAAIASLPFCLRSARAAIEGVDPAVEEAARVMGLPEWRVALHVTLPLARRGIVAGVALAFARALGDFGTTVMVAGNIPGRTQTLPISVYDAVQAGRDRDAATAAFVLLVVAAAILIVVGRMGRPAHA
jgi:molybdate transport system permease protein